MTLLNPAIHRRPLPRMPRLEAKPMTQPKQSLFAQCMLAGASKGAELGAYITIDEKDGILETVYTVNVSIEVEKDHKTFHASLQPSEISIDFANGFDTFGQAKDAAYEYCNLNNIHVHDCN